MKQPVDEGYADVLSLREENMRLKEEILGLKKVHYGVINMRNALFDHFEENAIEEDVDKLSKGETISWRCQEGADSDGLKQITFFMDFTLESDESLSIKHIFNKNSTTFNIPADRVRPILSIILLSLYKKYNIDKAINF